MKGLLKPCLDCGDLSPESRCEQHAAERARITGRQHERSRSRLNPRERGYDAAWVALSKRARRMQPWCSDCSGTEDLSADHLPSAWERKAQGKPIRLCDVDVVCNGCNTRRDSSRPGTVRATSAA